MAEANLDNIRHSCAHLLAAAVLSIWPKTKLAIGPSIENGFYYDFEFENPISDEDLPKIEKKMAETLPTWTAFERREISAKAAREIFKNNPYKLELIDELEKAQETITIYKSGEFEDLCRGGHAENPSKDMGAFKLLSVAGAYWRGSEKNPMLTRIYGTCFSSKEELEKHLGMIEEAKKRDHRKLGKMLELFMFDSTSPGMPYWLPKGTVLYNELLNFSRKENQKRGYHELITPLLNKKELYVTSGHWNHFLESMFITKTEEKETYAVKPMNCPNAMVVFGSKVRSYRDLPLRLSDYDSLHRFERSGTLNGLLRVREFKQDDAHIFVSEEGIKDEYRKLFELIDVFYSTFALEHSFRLGTRPKEFMGDKKTWDKAEVELKEILDQSGKDYIVLGGDGAFYGPKIDILIRDSIGREWQMGTVQLDFQMPKNFGLKYSASDGKEKTPVTIHRAIYGSFERFIAILIEHFGGAFPIWLAPVQAIVLPISDKFLDYANLTREKFIGSGIRIEVDDRSETLQAKIRDAAMSKIPYQLIVGGKEVESETVAVRTREGKDLGQIKIEEFLETLKDDIDKKS